MYYNILPEEKHDGILLSSRWYFVYAMAAMHSYILLQYFS